MADDEQQKIKKIAAAAYDYEGDSRWADYWSNILIPPQTSRSDVIDRYKRKFYKRYIDPDFVVESVLSKSTSQSTRPSTAEPQHTRSRRPNVSTTGTRTTPPAANAAPLGLNRQTIQFSVNAWILIVTLLGILPIGSKNLSNKASRLSLLGTALSSAYSLYILYGKPRAWNMQAIQIWFQSIVQTKDFVCVMYCLVLVSFQTTFKFSMLPLLCRVLVHNARFLRHNFGQSTLYRKYLENICLWVEANTTTISILSSNAEIAMGFLLIISIFSAYRNIVPTFMYWNLLKVMYRLPATGSYHRSTWAKISHVVMPYIYRYAMFLNTPLMYIQRWWLQ